MRAWQRHHPALWCSCATCTPLAIRLLFMQSKEPQSSANLLLVSLQNTSARISILSTFLLHSSPPPARTRIRTVAFMAPLHLPFLHALAFPSCALTLSVSIYTFLLHLYMLPSRLLSSILIRFYAIEKGKAKKNITPFLMLRSLPLFLEYGRRTTTPWCGAFQWHTPRSQSFVAFDDLRCYGHRK